MTIARHMTRAVLLDLAKQCDRQMIENAVSSTNYGPEFHLRNDARITAAASYAIVGKAMRRMAAKGEK